MKIVISQSMFFPWIGLLEQIRLAEIFVHYDDVQFSKGSFVNRVQLKTSKGVEWMTVPLQNLHLGQKIEDVEVSAAGDWQERHFEMLRRSLEGTPYFSDAINMVREVYSRDHGNIGALARASMLALADYFSLGDSSKFSDVTKLQIYGSSTGRVLAVAKHFEADTYITGHGASRYLDHVEFERQGISVDYINYRCTPYPQLHGEFTPYVSALDLVANCGKKGIQYICSSTKPWREFVEGSD
jgi:WbqC-like protein family